MVKTSKIWHKVCTFVITVHTTLPTRTASQGVSFALYTFLLNTIQPNNQFTTRLNDLFIKYSNVNPNALGI